MFHATTFDSFRFRVKRRKKFITGGLMGLIGYILSPLSFWNDLYVNIPLAYAGAWLVSLFYKHSFLPAFVVTYWITNILGFVLMHFGATKIVARDGGLKKSTWRVILKDVLISTAYMVLVIILVKAHIIQPIGDYFK